MKLLKILLQRNSRALYPGAERVPEPLLREALEASREKHYWLGKRLYPRLFGPDWDYTLLGFAYVKCIDDVADDERDPQRALAFLGRQRRLLEATYAGGEQLELPLPDRFGQVAFRQDARGGAPLRSCFEDIFAVMEFDVHRRGRVLPAAELEEHLVNTGEPGIRFMTRFAAPQLELSRSYLRLVSHAYLWADSLIDLEYDLRHGLVNIPAEAVERFGLTPAPDDEGLPAWLAAQGAVTMGYFEEALAETDKLEDESLVLFSRLYLGRKRKKLERFFAKRDIAVAA